MKRKQTNKQATMIAALICAVAAIASCAKQRGTELPPNQAEFGNEHVRIRLRVRSNIYSYEVTNLSTSVVVSFEMETPTAISFTVPKGWEKETSSGISRAHTEDPRIGIPPNGSAEFTVLAGGRGPVLGRVPVRVGLLSGRISLVEGVWAPIREPHSYIMLIVCALTVIVTLHTAILIYKDNKPKKALVSDA